MPPVETAYRSSAPEESVNGLFYFDGIVWMMNPIKGAEELMILFPSRLACPISGKPSDLAVRVCGDLWLPFYATCDQGFREASDWGKYRVEQVSDDTLEIWGHSPELFRVKDAHPSHVLVRYDNEERRMLDVVFIKDVPGSEAALISGRWIK